MFIQISKSKPLAAQRTDPLKWWYGNHDRFPHLAALAKRYLSPPAASTSSERAFKVAKQVQTDFRTRLLPNNLESLVFLKHGIRAINYTTDLPLPPNDFKPPNSIQYGSIKIANEDDEREEDEERSDGDYEAEDDLLSSLESENDSEEAELQTDEGRGQRGLNVANVSVSESSESDTAEESANDSIQIDSPLILSSDENNECSASGCGGFLKWEATIFCWMEVIQEKIWFTEL